MIFAPTTVILQFISYTCIQLELELRNHIQFKCLPESTHVNKKVQIKLITSAITPAQLQGNYMQG